MLQLRRIAELQPCVDRSEKFGWVSAASSENFGPRRDVMLVRQWPVVLGRAHAVTNRLTRVLHLFLLSSLLSVGPLRFLRSPWFGSRYFQQVLSISVRYVG